MALNISEIVGQFKADVAKALSAETIVKICCYLGYTWRERVLDPVTTVQVFILGVSVLAMFALHLLVAHTRYGMAMRAIIAMASGTIALQAA